MLQAMEQHFKYKLTTVQLFPACPAAVLLPVSATEPDEGRKLLCWEAVEG